MRQNGAEAEALTPFFIYVCRQLICQNLSDRLHRHPRRGLRSGRNRNSSITW